MAISDVEAFAHLTDADLKPCKPNSMRFAAMSRSRWGARCPLYPPGDRIPAWARFDGPPAAGLRFQAVGLVGGVGRPGTGEDRREHGGRPQRSPWPVGLDERPGDPFLDVGVGYGRCAKHWRITHNFSHHKYTNILDMDDDVGLRLAARPATSPGGCGNLLNPAFNVLLAVGFEWGYRLATFGASQDHACRDPGGDAGACGSCR